MALVPEATGTQHAKGMAMTDIKSRVAGDDSTKPQTSTNDFDCLRCALILTGRSAEQAPEHSHRCTFRDTGKDPVPETAHGHTR